MSKQARTSSLLFSSKPYECAMPWPEECFCQAGDNGIVFTESTVGDALESPVDFVHAALDGGGKPHYHTAFFEAFPEINGVGTFLRGEGATIVDAEASAWEQYQKLSVCPGHEFEARGYTNGAGFCKHCGMFASNVIEPTDPCRKCGKPTWYGLDNEGRRWCERCAKEMPDELKTEARKRHEKMLRSMKEWEARIKEFDTQEAQHEIPE